MKIAVNTRLLRKNQMDGLGWFAYNTLKYIVQNNPSIEFHFLFDSGIDKEFLFAKNIVPHNLFPPAKHALLNVVWFEWSVKNFLQKLNPDLFLSPDGILCLGWKGKQYAMIADLNFYHNPEDLKWTNNKYYNYFFPRYAAIAARIATISEFSKQDIVQTFKVAPEKIDIVYCGINNFLAPVDKATQAKIRTEITGGKEYFIFVGTLHPRKNIVRLLKAFELFKIETNADLKLVIGGKPSYKMDDIYDQQKQMTSKDDVVFTGRIDDSRINHVLGSAMALTFVPHFEGFGIPIIEAMQCDIPVISSNTTSMPEVAGNAALLVDPYNVEAIKSAMVRLYSDPALRNELVVKGRLQKNIFSWERTANDMWKSIEKCL
ncbi:MAG: glycosyltransferase family 1 protein [Chitinophagaceae bacterium]